MNRIAIGLQQVPGKQNKAEAQKPIAIEKQAPMATRIYITPVVHNKQDTFTQPKSSTDRLIRCML